MRIGINAALLNAGGGYRQTGVSRYIGELIDALEPRLGAADHLVTMGRTLPAVASHPALRIAWEQTGLPLSAALRRVDVLHGPLNVVPLATRTPRVVTVHDLAFLRYPEHLPSGRRAYLATATRLSVAAAGRVIAVSRNTADDLLHWLALDEARIVVIPEAPSPRVRRLTGPALDAFRTQQAIDGPYILAVGTLEPRKNLETLLRAFAAVADRIPHQLVIVGPKGWLMEGFERTLAELGLGHRARLTGFVPDAELGGWYSGADVFAFPSRYEGFGLPAVEAMACGAPVLASDSSCFPEVVGDAGVLVPPTDTDVWADAVLALVTDRGRNDDLRRRSLARAAAFGWERTAAETLAVYREAGA